MTVARSAFTVGFYTLLSRFSGFARDMLVAGILGAGQLADVFFVAFKLPNFFRRLFAEGAFNSAFIPMFSSIMASDGHEKAIKFAQKIFTIMVFFLLLFTVVFQILMPVVMVVLAPGFVGKNGVFDLAVLLTRITFPYLMFISLVALMAGVLNGFGKFAAGASAPILLNLTLIAAIVWGKNYTETPAHALAWGVSAAGVIQFIWLYIACARQGIYFRLSRPRLNPQVKKMLKLMVPGIIGGGITQINLWIDVMIGTLITGAVSYLYYADRINQLPMSVIGTAVGTAMLPVLAKIIREGNHAEVIRHQNKALEFTMLITLPACVGMLATAHLMIATLFEHGAFTAEDTHATALALQAFALGLPAFVMIKVFQPGYFAAHDTATPVKYSLICMVINIVLNLAAVFGLQKLGFYPHVGIALATSFAGWVNTLLLARGLSRKGSFVPGSAVKIRLAKMLACSLLMGAVLCGIQYVLAGLRGHIAGEAATLVGVIAAALFVYFGAIHFTGTYPLGEVKKLLKRRKK